MELKQAKYLLEIYKHQNLTEAAQELFLSPQALSKQLKALEAEFGEEIVQRRGNRFAFTRFGEYLVSECLTLTAQYDLFRRNIVSFKEQLKTTIRLDAPSTSYLLLGYEFFDDFIASHEYYKLMISEYDEYEVDNRLHNDLCDVALCVNTPSHTEEIVTYPLRSYHLGCYMSAEHPLAGKEVITMEELAQYPILTRNEHFKSYHLLENAARREGVTLNYAFKTPSDYVWHQAILDNETIAISLSAVTPIEGRVFIDLERKIDWSLNVAVKRSRRNDPKISELVSYILEHPQPDMENENTAIAMLMQ